MKVDIAVVGGGPTGLALSIYAARRGLSACVFERQSYPLDKACGEGILPAGVRALRALGVALDPSDASTIEGVRYVQEDGGSAAAHFRGLDGLGVRRTALVEALRQSALGAGVHVCEKTGVRRVRRDRSAVRLWTDDREIEAAMLVAADGLHSPLRHSEGLDVPAKGPRRYGLRQHFSVEAWTNLVEVHFAPDAEAYVTPAGRNRVGVAFLFEPRGVPRSVEGFLQLFPVLAARLAHAVPDSEPRGAGPFQQASRRQVLDRFALLGDAAGYVDALTGEGISLGLRAAEALAGILPNALARGATQHSLLGYERAWRRMFRGYAWLARGLLVIARRPRLRQGVLRFFEQHPALLEESVAMAEGEPG